MILHWAWLLWQIEMTHPRMFTIFKEYDPGPEPADFWGGTSTRQIPNTWHSEPVALGNKQRRALALRMLRYDSGMIVEALGDFTQTLLVVYSPIGGISYIKHDCTSVPICVVWAVVFFLMQDSHYMRFKAGRPSAGTWDLQRA